jgi:hypothetical protein
MAAPTPTARVAPAGIKLKDGFPTKITLAADTNIEFWEKQVKPPGIDGGDAVVQTTMHNTTWRTSAPRSLRTLTDMTTTVAYDPLCYTSILAAINREDTITVTFPDGSTLCFYGYLKMFDPGELVEGTQPEATITIVPTNFDPSGKVEAAPVLTNVSGT